MQIYARKCIYVFVTYLCIGMLVHVAAYGHIYPHMQHLGAQEVHKILSQCIYTQEAGVCTAPS